MVLGVDFVSFDEWCNLDQHEINTGKSLSKPREKITCTDQMLKFSKNK